MRPIKRLRQTAHDDRPGGIGQTSELSEVFV
jgi:hypothetical protein